MERLATAVARWTGSTSAFSLALAIILVWALTGPLFQFSDTWQLVINTGTTIVTFLMVFLIQRTQNKDSLAIHLKLNELVAALEGASNRLDRRRVPDRGRAERPAPALQQARADGEAGHEADEVAFDRGSRRAAQAEGPQRRRRGLTCTTETASNPGADPRRHPRSGGACGRMLAECSWSGSTATWRPRDPDGAPCGDSRIGDVDAGVD